MYLNYADTCIDAFKNFDTRVNRMLVCVCLNDYMEVLVYGYRNVITVCKLCLYL